MNTLVGVFMEKNTQTKNPTRKFTITYVIALTLIAILSISSQFLIRTVLGKQEKDARIINISGRQRMLSQKISKIALQIKLANTEKEYRELQTKLAKNVSLWSSSHQGLQLRDESLGLGGENSQTIKKMFEEVDTYYQNLNRAARQIIISHYNDRIGIAINNVLFNEGPYLKRLNDITFQYDKESVAKITDVKEIEIILLVVTLLAILFEGFFIFRPVVKAIDAQIYKINEKNLDLKKVNQKLIKSEKIQEKVKGRLFQQLERNHQLQLERNQSLEKEIEERTQEISDQKEEILQQRENLKLQNDKISKFNKKLKESISYARKLQQSILGNQQDIIKEFQDGFILSKPKDIISGDFYWFYKKGNRKYLVVADCTGHGVPASFLTIIGSLLLNEIIEKKDDNTSLSEILSNLDKELFQLLNEKNYEKRKILDGMDLALIEVNYDDHELKFVGAKRPLYFVKENEKVEKIKGSKSSIGYNSRNLNKSFEVNSLNFNRGDRIYLTSDGFQDQFGEVEDMKFMQARMIDTINSLGSYKINTQMEVLDDIFEYWKGSVPQTDDVLFVGIEL